jgi:hypothetical protein
MILCSRVSLLIGLVSAAVALLVGGSIGTLAGYHGVHPLGDAVRDVLDPGLRNKPLLSYLTGQLRSF